jgi:hypothetical protein
MARRLRKLRIHEISLVDRGAGEACHIRLMKRDVDTRITEGRMETQETTIEKRVRKLQKADTGLSRQRAILKIAESRDPADQAAWREYKLSATVPQPAPETQAGPTIPIAVNARIEELQKADTGLSRERAVAKIAGSAKASDQELWRTYKAAPALMPQVADAKDPRPEERTSNSPNMTSLRGIADSIRAQFPGRYDDDQALLIAAKTPKGQVLLAGHRDKDFARLLGHA